MALLALIAVYVAVTGAGPSIQRAGVMGAAGVVAGSPAGRALAGTRCCSRSSSPWRSTPEPAADVGWQLSFAATAGIMLWSARLAALLAADARAGSTRRALADGAAVTIAATAATAPLMAHHFDALSVASLPANLLALPAVAPAMWLGMLVGVAGQLSAIPVEPLNWLNSLLLAYIAQVARWLAEPSWASLRLDPAGIWPLVGTYLLMLAAGELGLRAARRRAGLALARAEGSRAPALVRRAGPALAVALLLVLLATGGRGGAAPAPDDALTVSVLDVGQGDSILLDPPRAPPCWSTLARPTLTSPSSCASAASARSPPSSLTHDQSDHVGGAFELLDSLPVARLGYARIGRELLAGARAAGVQPLALAEGSEIRDGELRLEVLWPPAGLLDGPAEDPNQTAVVLLAEWRHFSMLLAADAEAEAVPLDPGPVDVLKVAHHGSEDAGLGALLDRAMPELAVISVGDENTYGHPTPETLAALSAHRVPTLRTDESGTIRIVADESGWRVG